MVSSSASDTTEDTRLRVLALLRRHGWNATSFQTLETGYHYWFDGEDACVAYADTGVAWVAAGAPIAATGDLVSVGRHFAAAAAAHHRRVCFFATERRFSDEDSFRSLAIGEQPVWDPTEWEATLRSSSSLREQIRRGPKKGLTVRFVASEEIADATSPTRRQIAALIARWLGARDMAPMGFLVDVQPYSFPEERRYLVAEVDGRVVGFLAAVPVYARGGWFIEDLVRDATAPNGCSELLVDTLMKRLGEEGCHYLTLGLAPLSGSLGVWLSRARLWGRALYDFHGLVAFKSRLRPGSWQPLHLTYPSRQSVLLSLHDSLVAFARGSLFRFALETVLRGPRPVLQMLAALLVPWTILLALAGGPRFFPSEAIHGAWVVFDGALIMALLSLGARFRPVLATLLAVAVTSDAALTLTEAAVYNAPRARNVADWLIIAAACLAPSVAAVILWSARKVRSVPAARAETK